MDEPIEYLPWDSQFFQKRIGRLVTRTNKSLNGALEFANQQRYELLYVYSQIPIVETSIGSYVLLDVGGHITLTHDLPMTESDTMTSVSKISEYCHDTLTPEMLELAYLSGHLSRFKIDPLLPVGSFESLYETWLVKTLENRQKAAIYTSKTDCKIAGLITADWLESSCTIGLLAVMPSCQGHGIATGLIKYLKDVCVARRIEVIDVKTQLANQQAIALYLKNSFVEKDRSFLYHAHQRKPLRDHET